MNVIKEYIFFQDMSLLRLHLENQQNFYLNFEVDVGNDKYIKQIIKMCIEHDTCEGVIFYIDKNRFIFDKLFFLKDLIEQLLVSKKKVAMRGVPDCVPRTLLGGYLYMRYINNKVPEIFERKYDIQVTKEFLSMCKLCIDKDICIGTSGIDFEKFNPTIKKSMPTAFLERIKPFDKELVFLNSMHKSYMNYCYQKKSPVCYRTVYYVSNIDFHSEYSYADRFVYGCDYMGADEYMQEFEFLRANTIHHTYIDLLESIASVEKTSQIAYSLAQKGDTYRESFYMFASKQYGDKILVDFHISYDYPKSHDMTFIGLGIDVIDDQIEGYKLYFQSSKIFLQLYLEQFVLDISSLSHKSHYLVLRLNKDQDFVAYKVELLILHEDLRWFKELIDNYDYYDKKLKPPGLYNIAIEIADNKISKINIYHRNYLTKSDANEI